MSVSDDPDGTRNTHALKFEVSAGGRVLLLIRAQIRIASKCLRPFLNRIKTMQAIKVSPFMTVDECAEYLRVNRQTLYRWAQCGKIPSRKANGKVLFHQGDIDAWTAGKASENKTVALSPFEQARMRLRSLKTEHTGLSLIQKG